MKPSRKLVVGGVALVMAMTGGAFAAGYNASGGSDAGQTAEPAATEKAAGSTEPIDARAVAASSPLPAFDDCKALTRRMQHLALPYVDAYGLRGSPRYEAFRSRFGGAFPMAAGEEDPGAPAADAGAAADTGAAAPASDAAAPAAAAAAPPEAAAATGAAAADTGAAAREAAAADAGPAASAGASSSTAGAATKSATAAKAAPPKAAAGESAGAGGQNDRTVDASRAIDKAGVTVDSDSPRYAGSTATRSMSSDNDPDEAVGPGETGTNLQEKDVDEPDTAKTDGRLIVSLTDQWLRVVDVSGKEPVARGALNLWELGVRPEELLLSGHRALVFGTVARHQGPMAKPTKERDWYSPAAGLALVDLSNPDDPRILATERITGKHVSARMTGETVRVVVSSTPDLPFIQPGYNPGSRESAEDANRDVIKRATADDWRPTRILWDGSSSRASEPVPLVDCEDVRYPTIESGLDLLTVLTMDLGSDDALADADATSVVAAGDLVYASPERLYVATTEGGWGEFAGRRGDDDGKVSTAIHEFDISGDSDTPYRSSGDVEGYIPGRWAMSEYEGDLRLVTTTSRPWDRWGGGSSVSNIVVLRPKEDRLAEVGHVSGMGKGETVRSVRWFDELAAVVTFRQTDPLYLVDMSTPEKPVVRGELKIPGYSAYMHPIGDRRLLGVGQDGTEWGGQLGLQVSAFDIADPDNPRRTDAVGWGNNSRSAVEDDPRTFVYLPDRRMALMPASIREFRWRPGLVSVSVSQGGELTKGAQWYGGRFGGVVKIMSLPGGRMAAIERNGITVLDTDDMRVRGSTGYLG